MHSGRYIYLFLYHPLHVEKGTSVATSAFVTPVPGWRYRFPASFVLQTDVPRHVFDVALSRAKRTFYHHSSPIGAPHLPFLSLPYTEEIYSLRRPIPLLSCRFIFRQVNILLRNLKMETHAAPCA